MTVTTTKTINLSQLEAEMRAAGVIRNTQHLGQQGEVIHSYTQAGAPVNFADEPAAQAVVDAHVALRTKTIEEYAVEYKTTTDQTRQIQILAMVTTMLDREKVPDTTPPSLQVLEPIITNV